jgi:hypothetical protein
LAQHEHCDGWHIDFLDDDRDQFPAQPRLLNKVTPKPTMIRPFEAQLREYNAVTNERPW